jgi:hypothetical protein
MRQVDSEFEYKFFYIFLTIILRKKASIKSPVYGYDETHVDKMAVRSL